MNKRPAFNILDRKKDRDTIAEHIEEFLAKGGKIKVLSSAFDKDIDPKCRVADHWSLFN